MQSAIPDTILLIALESIARPPKARNQNLKHNVLYELRRQTDSGGLIWSRMDCGVVVGDILSMLCVSFRLLCCYHPACVQSHRIQWKEASQMCFTNLVCSVVLCIVCKVNRREKTLRQFYA